MGLQLFWWVQMFGLLLFDSMFSLHQVLVTWHVILVIFCKFIGTFLN